MSLAKKLIGGVLYLSGANILTKLFSFFSIIIITRELSLYGFGALTLALALGGPIAALSELGLSELIASDVAVKIGEKNFSYAKKLLLSFTKIKVLITTAMIIGAWFLKPFLVSKYGAMVGDYYFWLSIWIYVQMAAVIFNIIFSVHEKFKYQSISNVTEVASKLVYVIIFWQTIGLTPVSVLGVYILSKLTAVAISTPLLLKTVGYLKNIAGEKSSVLIEILKRHGKWEIVKGIFTTNIEAALRPWIIRFILGVESVAVLEVAHTVYSAASAVFPVKSVIFPVICQNIGDLRVAQIIAQKATKYAFLFFGAVILGAFILADPFIRLVFPKYIDSIFLFRILIFRLLPTAIEMAHSAFYYALKEQKTSFYLTLINIVAMFTTLPVFTYTFRIAGPYLEKFFTLSVGIYLRERYLRKKKNIATWKWKNLFIFDQYDKYILNLFWGRAKRLAGVKV